MYKKIQTLLKTFSIVIILVQTGLPWGSDDDNQNKIKYQLTLKNCDLLAIPSYIVNYGNLQKIDVSGNQITVVPPTFGQLTHLQVLLMGCNQIATLPPGLGTLPNLKILDVSNNVIQSIPGANGWGFKVLETLTLSRNQITAVVFRYNALPALKALRLQGNPLSEWQAMPGALVNLRNLNLSGNQPMPYIYNIIDDLESLEAVTLPNSTPDENRQLMGENFPWIEVYYAAD